MLTSIKVSLRENHRCAVTGIFDRYYKDKLVEEKRYDEIPLGVTMRALAVAHIIPTSFNNLQSNTGRMGLESVGWKP